MKRVFLSTILLTPFFILAQSKSSAKKIQPVKKVVQSKKVYDGIIKTNNADTLYFDIDNSIILTPKNQGKAEYYCTATSGEISKLAGNFFQLGNIKDKTVKVSVFEKNTNKLVEEKTFVVAKQILPF